MKDLLTTTNAWLLVIGLLGGTLSGALGVGAGIIFVPALVLLMEINQKVAQGTTLAVMVPMALMGAWRYHANPDITLHTPTIVILTVGAVIGANLGAAIAHALPDVMLRRAFGILAVVVGAKLLFAR